MLQAVQVDTRWPRPYMRKCREMESSSRKLGGQLQARAADGASLPIGHVREAHTGTSVLRPPRRPSGAHAASQQKPGPWPAVRQPTPPAGPQPRPRLRPCAERDAAGCTAGRREGRQSHTSLRLSSLIFKKWVTMSAPRSDEEDSVTWSLLRLQRCARVVRHSTSFRTLTIDYLSDLPPAVQ